MQLVGGGSIGRWFDDDIGLPTFGDRGQIGPHTFGQASQEGGPQCGGLLVDRATNSDAELVGLDPKQEIHDRGATIDA